MIAAALTAQFDDAPPADVAAQAQEAGYDALDVWVADLDGLRESLAAYFDSALPPALVSLAEHQPSALRTAARVCRGRVRFIRSAPWPPTAARLSALLTELVAVARGEGVTFLMPHHSAGWCREPAQLAALLADQPPEAVRAVLAPDQVARPRDLPPTEWLARLPLPAAGAVAAANFKWVSELSPGNVRSWAPRLAPLSHGLTPWAAWLERLAADGFDGVFTLGDALLPAAAGDRPRTARDDLRYLRRAWRSANRPARAAAG
ncbi:MAG: hypothetical protein IT204_00715 [Fimbriimonadaceae bacterium]|nr:hypothetical protein [Fimbriimonadaceae bacterium]